MTPLSSPSDQFQQSPKKERHQIMFWSTVLALIAVPIWAATFSLEENAKATGEVIASRRVQNIESVDGGVLSELLVKEGDRVKAGQVLAVLDQTRVGATLAQVNARVFALKAKQARLRAEVTGAETIQFPLASDPEFVQMNAVERSLFIQRRQSLDQDLTSMRTGLMLAQRQLQFVTRLNQTGDASGMELVRAQQGVNDAEARLNARRNKFYEDARLELTTVENELAQASQEQLRRRQEKKDSVFRSSVNGIVKNVKTTTIGGVIAAGEELMQIVPLNDTLLIEAKVKPADIGRISKGLSASVRFDPYDYTIYGSVPGKVVYVSADTLKESSLQGETTYYRVHVGIPANPVRTDAGRILEVLPGMTGQIFIKTGSQTLLDYILKPIKKTLSDSFREP